MRYEDLLAEWGYAERECRPLDLAEELIVYGAGKGGEQFYRHWSEKAKLKILFFVDDDPGRQTSLAGIPVYGSERLVGYRETPVMIACAAWRAVVDRLSALGVRRFYFSDDAFVHIQGPGITANRGHFDAAIMRQEWSAIEACAGLFADEESARIFEGLIRYRLTRHVHHVFRSNYREYAHPKVRAVPGDIVIDAGAWIGDTTEDFAKAISGQGHIYAFEPDPANVAKARRLLEDKGLGGCVSLVSQGLADFTGEASFRMDAHSFASRIDPAGTCHISVVALDDYCQREGIVPALIKMDIEGAEPAAIEGGRRVIVGHAPKLQICLYHNPTDLWRIPLRIHELQPGYDLYLGQHATSFHDCILYAVRKAG